MPERAEQTARAMRARREEVNCLVREDSRGRTELRQTAVPMIEGLGFSTLVSFILGYFVWAFNLA